MKCAVSFWDRQTHYKVGDEFPKKHSDGKVADDSRKDEFAKLGFFGKPSVAKPEEVSAEFPESESASESKKSKKSR